MRDEIPDLITRAEAAKMLRVSVWQIGQMCRSGRLPSINLGYNMVRIERRAVLELIERSRVTGKQEAPCGSRS